MATPPPVSFPALDSTLGAIELGIIISLCLYGAAVVQVFTYYQSGFKNEQLHVKLMVVWCCIVETVHTVFISIYLYDSTIRHFGDYSYLPVTQWPLSFSVAVSTFVSAPVQIFFAYRVYTLSQSYYFPIASCAASIIRLGFSIATSSLSEEVKVLVLFEHKYLWMICFAIATGGTVDVANTIALCYYLIRSKTTVSRSRKMIDRLIVWSIETGLITSLSNVVMFIFLVTMQKNTIWMCPLMFSAKLYSNSFFASLNGRISLRAASATTHVTMSTFAPNTNTRIVFSENTEIDLDMSMRGRNGAHGTKTGLTSDTYASTFGPKSGLIDTYSASVPDTETFGQSTENRHSDSRPIEKVPIGIV